MDATSPSNLISSGWRTGITGFFVGAYSVFWGLLRILRDGGLRKLAILPLILTSFLYAGMVGLLVVFGDDLFDWLWQRPEGWLVIVWWIALVASIVATIGLMVLLFAAIAEAIGGPFYDKMAIRVLTAHSIESREPGLIEGTVPDVLRSLLFLIPAAICWMIGLIPLVGLPFVALGASIASIGFASAAINPALMVTGHDLGDRMRYVFRFFLGMLGMGAVVSLSMLVPFLGLLSIPASIVGASELYANTKEPAR
jgi:CysZ protein